MASARANSRRSLRCPPTARISVSWPRKGTRAFCRLPRPPGRHARLWQSRNAIVGRDTYGLGSAALLAAWCGDPRQRAPSSTRCTGRILWVVAALIWAGWLRRRSGPAPTSSPVVVWTGIKHIERSSSVEENCGSPDFGARIRGGRCGPKPRRRHSARSAARPGRTLSSVRRGVTSSAATGARTSSAGWEATTSSWEAAETAASRAVEGTARGGFGRRRGSRSAGQRHPSRGVWP